MQKQTETQPSSSLQANSNDTSNNNPNVTQPQIIQANFSAENPEKVLKAIAETWQVQNLEIESHMENSLTVSNTEKISQLLEAHLAIFSQLRAHPAFVNFEGDIADWIRKLNQVEEGLELLTQVQRLRSKLAPFFTTEDQLQKQLLGDTSRYQKYNEKFLDHLKKIQTEKNAIQGLTNEEFSKDLCEISAKFDETEKILFSLLELRRKEFPRFYFLSNEELFSLLGHPNDPTVINKCIQKFFPGIKTLQIQANPKKNSEIVAMISPEGEIVNLVQPISLDSQAKTWGKGLETEMKNTLKTLLYKAYQPLLSESKDLDWIASWIHDFPGSLLVLALQIKWTRQSFLIVREKTDKNLDIEKAWKNIVNDQTAMLNEFLKLARKTTNPIDRLKLEALITGATHLKAISEDFASKNIDSQSAFEWESQLKFESVRESESLNCIVKQKNFEQEYGFEYQGNTERQVITPITERCYLFLTTAVQSKTVGALQGPATTGKTETVKDLAKAIGKPMFNLNCTPETSYRFIGMYLSALVQTGFWGCFDEFNRIQTNVLSVLASQLASISNALRSYTPQTASFFFETDEILINPDCAIFLTMVPNAIGRSQLPYNLKFQFRALEMVTPDSQLIAEVRLLAQGFTASHCSDLAKKLLTLYNSMSQEFSKCSHYDFSMPSIRAVLTRANALRKAQIPDKFDEKAETSILMKAIRDINLPMLLPQDVPKFNAFLSDIFKAEIAPADDNELKLLIAAIAEELKASGLQVLPSQIAKMVQLFNLRATRHGNMLIGPSMAGKSTCWKILQRVLNRLSKGLHGKFPNVRPTPINPKAIDSNELFGYVDKNTSEWFDGVLSHLMRSICKEEENTEKWVVFDGPVDPLWVESLNSALDETRTLNLSGNLRFILPPQISFIFEVEDLAFATPSTISRCGMVYFNENEPAWKVYVASWIGAKKDPELRARLTKLFDKWVDVALKTRKSCENRVPYLEISLVISLCKLLDALDRQESSLKFKNPDKTEEFWKSVEKWFIFALLWSIGATVDENGRKAIDTKLREIDSSIPTNIYDYYVSSEKGDFLPWENRVPKDWKPSSGTPFHLMIVPTVDIVKNSYLLESLLKSSFNILIAGAVGSGKSISIRSVLNRMAEAYTPISLSFSAYTTSQRVQQAIEGKLTNWSKARMLTDSNKKAVIVIDDLNMPKKEKFGAQPPLELLRQFIDYGGWYDREHLENFKRIEDCQLLATMRPLGTGDSQIPQRLQSKFTVLGFAGPNEHEATRVFQSILSHYFSSMDLNSEVKDLAGPLASATVQLCKTMKEKAGSNADCCYTMRDMAKVIQGICQIDQHHCSTKSSIFRLWGNECLRVFQDIMGANGDNWASLPGYIADKIEADLQSNSKEFLNKNLVYTDFLTEAKETSEPTLEKSRDTLEKFLKKYNEESPGSHLNLIFFKDAINTLSKIYRIIKTNKGHALLVGDAGSGRRSLTKLAAFTAGYKVFQIQPVKNYGARHFREDLKKFCSEVGINNSPAVFLISDSEIVIESCMDDLNCLISTGEVPNLFSKTEKAEIISKCKEQAKLESNQAAWSYFQNNVMNKLHIVLSFSNSEEIFQKYTRSYPGLIKNTTLVWLGQWTEETLNEIAENAVSELKLEPDTKQSITTFLRTVHSNGLIAKMYQESERSSVLTPVAYLDFVQNFGSLYEEQRKEIIKEIERLSTGLKQLEESKLSTLDTFRAQWHSRRKDLEEQLHNLTGDCLISAAFLAYAGTFPAGHRKRFEEILLETAKALKIPHTSNYSGLNHLGKIAEWISQGLPADNLALENALLVTRSSKWPLCIDSQGLATKWIKNLENENLVITNSQDTKAMAKIEKAITLGHPVLFQLVRDEVPSLITPILNKVTKTKGEITTIKLGDKEIKYAPSFKFYMTTSLSNPKLSPEVTSKVNLVNFSVNESIVEELLRSKITELLMPPIEARRKEYLKERADNEKKLLDLNNQALDLLQALKGSITEEVELTSKLQQLNDQTTDITKKQRELDSSLVENRSFTQKFDAVVKKASLLFSVMTGLSKLNDIYQFSLDSYIHLFTLSIGQVMSDTTLSSADLQQRVDAIDKAHQLAVYNNVCRSLFEKDIPIFTNKLLDAKFEGDFGQRPPLDLELIYTQSRPTDPVIFILNEGANICEEMNNFALKKNNHLWTISLGEGMFRRAQEKIHDSIKSPMWVFLENIQLSPEFLANIESYIDSLSGSLKENFRLWLTAEAGSCLPVTLIQRSLKVVVGTEAK